MVNVVANYQITPQWSAGTKLRYNSGPRVTPIVGTYQDSNGVWQSVYGAPYSMQMGDYLRWDLRTDYSFLYYGSKLDLYLDVINLLGHQNPTGLSDQQGDVKVVNGFPRFPLLGMDLEF